MDNWRIQTFFEGNQSVVKPTSSALGYTVIKAIKGTDEPMYFDVGQASRMIACMGYPASDNGVQNAIDYNIKAPMYVSAPSTGGTYGGVFVTKTGSLPFFTGYQNWTTFDLTEVPQGLRIGVGDATEVTFTGTLPRFANYVPESISILINGTADTLVFEETPTPGTEEFTSALITAGSLTLATGALSITFTVAPALLTTIDVREMIDISADTYFTLRSFSKHVDDIATKVTSTGSGLFTINVYAKNVSGVLTEISESPYNVSLDPYGKDGYGRNIYIENVLKDNIYIRALDTAVAFTTMTNDVAMVSFAGGLRGTTIADSVVASTYLAMTDSNKYPIKVFFDGNATTEVATAFETMRSTNFKRSRFIVVTPDNTAASLVSGGVVSKYSLSNRGIYVYCLSWGIHVDTYRGNSFNCSNVGLIAGRHADSINSKYKGGVGPMWIDENNVGGILGSSIISLNQGVDEIQSRALDALHINPIKFDFTLGAVISSQRTTLVTESDYSYIGHSGCGDYIAYNIETNVLPYQIGKLNDVFHRASIKANAETVLSSVSELLYDYAIKCDEQNNGADVLNAKKFVLTIGVQYTPQSEMIDFIFINSPIGTDLNEVVNNG